MIPYLSLVLDFFRPYDRKQYRLQRVAVEVDKLERELSDASTPLHERELEMARNYLETARRQVDAGNSADTAWRYLHAANTARIPALDEPAFEAQAIKLKFEAGKLGGWRNEAAKALIGDDPIKKPPTPEALMLAASVLYEHYDNQAYKRNLLSRLKSQMIVLLILSVGQAIYLLSLLENGGFPMEGVVTMPMAVAVFGWLGASTSAVFRAADANTAARIPQIASMFRVTALRIAAGIASALAIYLVLVGGHMELANIKVSADESESTLLLFAFAAGFTERLVLKVMERMS